MTKSHWLSFDAWIDQIAEYVAEELEPDFDDILEVIDYYDFTVEYKAFAHPRDIAGGIIESYETVRAEELNAAVAQLKVEVDLLAYECRVQRNDDAHYAGEWKQYDWKPKPVDSPQLQARAALGVLNE